MLLDWQMASEPNAEKYASLKIKSKMLLTFQQCLNLNSPQWVLEDKTDYVCMTFADTRVDG